MCVSDDVLYKEDDPIPTATLCERCVCRPPDIACEAIKCEKKSGCRAIQRPNECCPEYKCGEWYYAPDFMKQVTKGDLVVVNFNPDSNNTNVMFTQYCELEVAITAVADPEGSPNKMLLTLSYEANWLKLRCF